MAPEWRIYVDTNDGWEVDTNSDQPEQSELGRREGRSNYDYHTEETLT